MKNLKIVALFIVFAALVPFGIAWLDYMMNDIGYFYGLQFSWVWAFQWWLGLTIVMLSVSVLVSLSYLLLREESKRNYYTAFMLGLTMWWQQLSGNMDLIFFLFDKIRGTWWIKWDTIWWWSPFNWLFGFPWTSKQQVAMTALLDLVLIGLWVVWLIVMNRDLIWQSLNS
jgi:hypothetical protein